MKIIHRIYNKIADAIYTSTFPNIGKGCRISHNISINSKKNLFLGSNSSIGSGATIINTRAKVIIGHHFVSGPNLTIITGDHMPMIGRFLNTVSDADKNLYDSKHIYDQDVIIKEDVWTGYGVTILKGVTIGRGAIISAGAVVNKDIPPYCIGGGIPAKPIKLRWTIEQILEHESKLYTTEERYTKAELEEIFKSYAR